MVAMNKFTASYAQSLLAATPQTQLVEPSKPKRIKGLTEKQMLLMQRESANLDRQFKLVEQTYGNDHLDLVLVNGYVGQAPCECARREISDAALRGDPRRVPEDRGRQVGCRLSR